MTIKDLFSKNLNITYSAAALSIVNLLFFHIPFYSYVSENINPDFNGFCIMASLLVIMLVANFFGFYLTLFLGRIVGKILIAITFILNSVSIYFINTYDVMLDDSMMSNVYNTNYAEATSYYSSAAILYIIFMGILPCIFLFLIKLKYGSWKKFGSTVGISLLIVLVLAFANATNWTWIDRHAPVIGSLLLPWSYIVNTVRLKVHEAQNNREEIILPDATIATDEKDVVVLVIGESSRRDHFSLYGYSKNTNPLLSQVPNLKYYIANSSATYTTAGVKAILEYADTEDLYEPLPNYLYRNGVDVQWRTTNWGEPPLHIEKYIRDNELRQQCQGNDCEYDKMLIYNLCDRIVESGNNKVLIVLHTSTSHGPSYNQKYPNEFEKFSPVCESVELSKCSKEELLNAYDNSIVYTDYLLNSIINDLQTLTDWNSTMIFVSDHGESLGEKNLYMHGVPISIAPKEQYEIPFIVWSSKPNIEYKDFKEVTQHHVFHSVLKFMGIESPIYNEEMNIFIVN
ncbi:MAG: phosphoethanolamine--lipid A transferase EptA [Paludibacteraceae bacterium]|nr:phosphoethanolamine--lipid A transferase EptA [Paludibacteraceae bacterium]